MTRDDLTRAGAAMKRPGWLVLTGSALSVAVDLWLARGVFVPIERNDVVEHVFVSATTAAFIAIAVATGALLVCAHVLVRRFASRRGVQPPLLSWEDTAYVRPLFCFASSLLPLLNLLPAPGRVLPVLSYVIVDLRWWWTGLVLAWLAHNIDVRSNSAWLSRIAGVRLSMAVRRRVPEVTLAGVAVAWAVAGTPILRTVGGTTGDEPRYVRYCENLYQGLGFDVSQIKPMSQLPADFRPRVLENFILLGKAIPGELRGLVSDAVVYVRNPSHRFNRARYSKAGFLDGKDGGMYQVHNPGLSFLMFPAYVIDRQFAQVQPDSPDQWPARLPAINAFFLAVYAVWTVLIFRFLRNCGATTGTAWAASLALMLTLPVAAFPFQYYPELAAGLFVSAVGSHILFGAPRSRASFFYGLLAGYLPWLHVRFILVMAALALGALVLWRGQRRRSVAFIAGVAIPAALFSLYAYRITGSVMPTALWSVEGNDNFVLSSMIKNSVGYLLDREWGLFAHSPVLLLALPGYWLMARRTPAVAGLTALVLLALLVPAAGRTLLQTTPMRLIVAVVPFGATPLIDTLAGRSHRVVQIVFGLLLVLSLDNALAYNLNHNRYLDTLVDRSFSGWKVNLLFPLESWQPWHISAANGSLLIAWIVIMIALLTVPALTERAREREWTLTSGTRSTSSIVRPAFAATALFVVLGTAISAATGVWTKRTYLIPPDEAAQQAALMVDDLGTCALCLSSKYGRMGAHRLVADLETIDRSVTDRQHENRDYKEWLVMPGQIRAWYIEANGHEPANTEVGHYLYQWREEHIARTGIRRRIFAAAKKAE